MGVLGKYCAECVYEREDQERLHFQGNINGRELLEKLQGFAVAGADGVFQWADAVIDGDTVVVSSASVQKPVAVRYAFASKHTWANLFNKDGLPALPFRTDPEGK